MNVQRITRLLKLLQMLQSGKGQNARGLAAECGVARRTVYRDLEALRQAGVPLEYDRDADCYSIPGTFFLPPTNFTAAEALALVALAAGIGRTEQLPFYEAAYTAALKLEGNLPAAIRKKFKRMSRSIHIRLAQMGRLADKVDVYQQLVDAIAARRVVRIEYDSLTEWTCIATKLRPYQLLFSRHSWYVIGRSSLHAEVRTFNLSRIVSLKTLGEEYVIPRRFKLERYLRNAWHLIPQVGRDYQVVVRFKPLVARNVAEVMWHKTQQTQMLDDGSLEFRARVSGLTEIVWWILGYGDQAEVIKPDRLRQLVEQRAKNMVAMYNGASK